MNKQEFVDQLRAILDKGMVPHIDVHEAYNISPEAITNLTVNETGIEFKTNFRGVKVLVSIDYKYILNLRSESKEERKDYIPGTIIPDKKYSENRDIDPSKKENNRVISLPKNFHVAQEFLNNIISRKLTVVFLYNALSFPNNIPADNINDLGIMQAHVEPGYYECMKIIKDKFLSIHFSDKVQLIPLTSILKIGCMETRHAIFFDSTDHKDIEWFDMDEKTKNDSKEVMDKIKSITGKNIYENCPDQDIKNSLLGKQEEGSVMKKQETNKCYKGNTGAYNPKKTDAVSNGKFFSFKIQVKRENGKIYLKEISNGKTCFSSISESVRDDDSTNVMLAKAHLIREVVVQLERGFDKLENPIGSKIKKENSNDAEFKKEKEEVISKDSNDKYDFAERMKKIDDDFRKKLDEFDERRKKSDEDFSARRKKLDDEIARLDIESKERMKKFLENREESNKMIEECHQNISEITKNNPMLADHFEEVKKRLACGDIEGAKKISGSNIEEFIKILGSNDTGKGKTH